MPTFPASLRRLGVLAFSVAAVAAGAVSTAPEAGAALSWKGDYETGDFSQWTGRQAFHGPLSVSTDYVRQGTRAARFEVNPTGATDPWAGERSEVWKKTLEQEGDESWWAWSTYFPDEFRPTPGTWWNIFTDWHHTGNMGQANVHFEVNTQTTPWTIQLRTFGGQQDQNQNVMPLVSFERNTWYDFVFHVKWEPDNTGFVEAWVNGEHVLPRTNLPTLYEGQGVYLKQGLYRLAYNQTSVVYHDATRRGTSFAAVAAGDPWLADQVEQGGGGQELPDGGGASEPGVVEPGAGERTIARVTHVRVPRRGKLNLRVRGEPGANLKITVRGPRGWRLGRSERRLENDGWTRYRLKLDRYRQQRVLKVLMHAKVEGQRSEARMRLRLSRDGKRILKTTGSRRLV